MSSGAEKKPPPSGALADKTALVAASARLLPELVAGLRAMGANAIPFPVLEAQEIEDRTTLDQAIARLDRYDWIVFTSAWGVTFFARHLRETGCGVAAGPKVCAIGPATAAAAKECGFSVELTAAKFIAEGVMESLELYHGGRANLKGLRVLIPRALEAREFLPEALAAAGCQADVAPCYRTVRPEPTPELRALLRHEIPDLIVFTSAAAVRNFMETATEIAGEERARLLLQKAVAAVIGPVAGKALEQQGRPTEIVPAESTVPALLDAIRDAAGRDRPASAIRGATRR